jgi:hypothetical protein
MDLQLYCTRSEIFGITRIELLPTLHFHKNRGDSTSSKYTILFLLVSITLDCVCKEKVEVLIAVLRRAFYNGNEYGRAGAIIGRYAPIDVVRSTARSHRSLWAGSAFSWILGAIEKECRKVEQHKALPVRRFIRVWNMDIKWNVWSKDSSDVRVTSRQVQGVQQVINLESNIKGVLFIVSMNTAAVTGCPSERRIVMP